LSNTGFGSGRRSLGALLFFLIAVVLLFGRKLASLSVEYQWWKEVGHLPTWFTMLQYDIVPVAVCAVVAFAIFWVGHARSMKLAGTGLAPVRQEARRVRPR